MIRAILGYALAFCHLFVIGGQLSAQDAPSVEPKAIPATRPEMKLALEALKDRTPRLPLPSDGSGQGVNNGRMRAFYIPEGWVAAGGNNRRRNSALEGTDAEKDFYRLLTSCFWVVSRGNNCHYCLGHQELKLQSAGLADDRIAALDCDWTVFDPRTQAALAAARKLTLAPETFGDQDISKLTEHFTEPEIIELIYSIARFNSTNRWTDGMGIPQDRSFHDGAAKLLTPTSPAFESTTSISAPTAAEAAFGATRSIKRISKDRIEAGLSEAHNRKARLPSLISDSRSSGGDSVPANWERALSMLKENGTQQAEILKTMYSDNHLSPRLKAEIAAVCALQNQAWYSLGHALNRLQQAGGNVDVAIAQSDSSMSSLGLAAKRLAEKATSTPHLISDADIAAVREHCSAEETAQIMHVICMSNLLDRFTEALGLPLESNVTTLSMR